MRILRIFKWLKIKLNVCSTLLDLSEKNKFYKKLIKNGKRDFNKHGRK